MRIIVRIFFDGEQPALLREIIEDPIRRCGVGRRLTRQLAKPFQENTRVVKRGNRRQSVTVLNGRGVQWVTKCDRYAVWIEIAWHGPSRRVGWNVRHATECAV